MNKINTIIRDLLGAFKRDYYSNRVRAVDSLVYLTYRCTSQCKTCNIWKRNAEYTVDMELGLAEWKKIVANIKDYGIKTMEIFGGDALLRKDIMYDVIRLCTKNGLETYFPTNSILLDSETAKNLAEAGLGTIYFSLDDVGSQNDLIRGKSGSAEVVKNAIENVRRARKKGKPHIVVCTTISNMNYNHFHDLVRFLNDLPVDAVYPRVMEEQTRENIENSVVEGIKPEPYFTSSDSKSHLLKESEVIEFKQIIKGIKKDGRKKIYINYSVIDKADIEAFTKGIHPKKKCLVCTNLVTIDPHGNVVPCPMYNKYILGNLMEESLKNIWGNEKHRKFIEKQRKNAIRICRNCILKNYHPSFSDSLKRYFSRAVEKITRKIA